MSRQYYLIFFFGGGLFGLHRPFNYWLLGMVTFSGLFYFREFNHCALKIDGLNIHFCVDKLFNINIT